MKRKFARSAMAGLCSGVSIAALVAAPTFAQDAEVIPLPTEASEETRDQVVVTGSRIRRNEFTSASPVQVIDPTLGELRGAFDAATLIQSSSIAAGSPQITSAISSNFVTNGGEGAQTISLRGLGAERTLVLLNGRRAGPAGTRGAVNAFDLNVLPQSVISSVEILKDGASSIYGSDAVAGVVNIITKRNQDGFTLDGFGSMPLKDGGEEFRAAATWGKEFSRGHIQASVDYFRRNELARGQRDYLNCGEDNYFTTTGGRADAVDPRNGQFKCTNLLWGHVWTYNYPVQAMFNPVTGAPMSSPVLIQYNYAGDNLHLYLPPFAAPTNDDEIGLPAGFFPVNYDRLSYALANSQHPFTAADTVIPKTELFTFYIDGAYQLGENVEVYAEVLGNRRESYVNSSRQFWQFGFPEDWCGFGFGDPLAEGWSGCILISPTPYTDHSDSSQRVDYLRALGGMRGDMPGDLLPGWKWDVYAQHSRNKGKYRAQRILQDAIDSQDDRGFSGVPCAGTTLPVSGRPCLDINWTDPEFLRGNLTDAQRAFLFDFEEGLTVYTQTYVEAIFDGDVIDLPAGTVKAAIGATWRRDEINDTPGPITLAGNAWGSSSAGITAGSSRTTEVFGEVDLPLIKDAPMIQSFTVQGAARFTDVSTFGSDVTYKVGANWQVNDWLRFRGTYGTSFRAPALFELFLADQTSFAQQRLIDPCITWGLNLANGTISDRIAANCAADGIPDDHTGAGISATVITGGGFGILEAETSKAKTLSVILTPTNLFGDRTTVNVAVDYFDIEVNGEIAQLGASSIIVGCYDSEFFPNEPLCDLFERGQDGNPLNIRNVRDSFINVNSQRNKGIDFTLRAQHELGRGLGDIDILSQFTLQLRDDIALFEGTVQENNGLVGDPKWVGDLNFLWKKDSWTFFWGTQLVGPASNIDEFLERFTVTQYANGLPCRATAILGTFCVQTGVDMVAYHSASIRKEFDRFSLTVGAANLFDKVPPAVSANSTVNRIGVSAFTSQYDYRGRRIFANASIQF